MKKAKDSDLFIKPKLSTRLKKKELHVPITLSRGFTVMLRCGLLILNAWCLHGGGMVKWRVVGENVVDLLEGFAACLRAS